jgi:ABC-type lipoprotein release transport system permease subunit
LKTSLLAFAVAALSRRRARAFGSTLGLAFAVALVASVIFVTESLRSEAERARAAQPDIVVQRLVGGRPTTITMAARDGISDIDSVRSVRPRVWGYVFMPALQGNVTIVGTASDAPALDATSGVLEKGRDLRRGAHEMIAGVGLAHALGMLPGDELTLPASGPKTPLKLVGTFSSALDLYTADVIVCDEDDARALLDMPQGHSTDLAVELANSSEARIVAGEILPRMPGARVIERDLLARVYHLAYGRRAGFVLGAALPALLALLVLAWDRASGVSPDERREIAILRAVGWSTSDVLWSKLFESLLASSAATAIGLFAAYAWVFWLGAAGLREVLTGWSVLYPRAALTPAVDLAQLLGIVLSVMGPFALVSVVPAWRAAKTDPLDAMRS